MLTSDARKTMGYRQYDITAALQSIVVEQLEAKGVNVKIKYPQHYLLVLNRKWYRAKIMKETGKDEIWGKKTAHSY